MDWRDLIAWQQIKTSVVPATLVNGNPLQLVGQNPQRIYLSISQQDGQDPHYLIPGNSPPAFSPAGIPIGGGTKFVVSNGAGTFSGTEDLTTGAFNGTTTDSSPESWSLPIVPATLEYWIDRHGALCQLGWWMIENGCAVVYFIVEVIQERNPCDYVPGTTTPRAKRKAGNCDPKQSLRQFTGIWHGATKISRGRNLFRPAVGLERPQDKPAVQPDQYQSGLD